MTPFASSSPELRELGWFREAYHCASRRNPGEAIGIVATAVHRTLIARRDSASYRAPHNLPQTAAPSARALRDWPELCRK